MSLVLRTKTENHGKGDAGRGRFHFDVGEIPVKLAVAKPISK